MTPRFSRLVTLPSHWLPSPPLLSHQSHHRTDRGIAQTGASLSLRPQAAQSQPNYCRCSGLRCHFLMEGFPNPHCLKTLFFTHGSHFVYKLLLPGLFFLDCYRRPYIFCLQLYTWCLGHSRRSIYQTDEGMVEGTHGAHNTRHPVLNEDRARWKEKGNSGRGVILN